ncbi:MAG: tetratricopeptide repeat protein, partial [Flavobacteriales bacterium]
MTFCCALAHAQDASMVPTYLKGFETATTDSARCHFLWQAAFNSAHSDAQKGIEYAIRALHIAQKIEHNKLIGDSENALGFCYENTGVMDSAMVHYSNSIAALNKSGNTCEIASVHANIGNMLKKQNDVKGALESFTRAEETQKNCPDIGYHASTFYSIGTCYNSLENYERSLEYFNRSLEKEVAANNTGKQGNVHNGKANAYLGLNDFVNADKEYREAQRCFMQTGNTYFVAYAYEGIAQLFDKKNQLDSAIFYCSQALNIFKELEVKFDIV